jgi:hypothetical protein
MNTFINYYIHDINLCINDLLISRLEEKEKKGFGWYQQTVLKAKRLGEGGTQAFGISFIS